MNQVFAFGAFVLGIAGIVLFLIGVFTTNPGMVLAAWILILAFTIIAFHTGINDFKEHHK